MGVVNENDAGAVASVDATSAKTGTDRPWIASDGPAKMDRPLRVALTPPAVVEAEGLISLSWGAIGRHESAVPDQIPAVQVRVRSPVVDS